MDSIKIEDSSREKQKGNANFEWSQFADSSSKSSEICNLYSGLFPNTIQQAGVAKNDNINADPCEDFDWEDNSGLFTNDYPIQYQVDLDIWG